MAKRKKSTFECLLGGQMNSKQRRELERRLSAEDPGLEIVNRNVAGIDVGNKAISWRCREAAMRSRCRNLAAGQAIWSGWRTG